MAPQHHYHPTVGGVGGNVGNWQFGDTTLTKIFVGGLAWETRRDALRRHFEQFGEILEAVVITDKSSGRSKGYGFVTFKDAESAGRACEDPAPMIDGRRANCNLACLGAAGIRAQPGNPTQQGFGRVIRPIIGSGPHSGFNPSSAATGLYYSPAPCAYHPYFGYPGTYPQENMYNPLNYYGIDAAGGQQPQLHFSNPYTTTTTTTTTGSSAFIHYPYYTQYAPSGGTIAIGVQYHPVLQQYQCLQQRQLNLQQYSTGFISSPPASDAGPATTTTTARPSSPPVTTAAEQRPPA